VNNLISGELIYRKPKRTVSQQVFNDMRVDIFRSPSKRARTIRPYSYPYPTIHKESQGRFWLLCGSEACGKIGTLANNRVGLNSPNQATPFSKNPATLLPRKNI
jgi:hypothetical protein